MPVNDYSTTPASNGSISGINIAEGCPPAGINDAIRQTLADIAGWRTGSVGTLFTGGGTMAGSYTFSGPVALSSTVTLSSPLAVAQGGTGVTTSTGTTSVVLSNSPVLVTPTLGVASATSIAAGLGAVGTPSYTFTGDTNTGMFSPAADTIAFSEGGVETMRIDSSGNVGIGTATPAQRLHVRQDQNGTTAALIQNRNGSGTPVSAVQFISGAFDLTDNRYAMISSAGGSNTTLQFWTGSGATPTERMRITDTGNVGIGTSTPEAVLDINGSQVTRGDASGYVYFAPKIGTTPFGANYDRFEIRVDPSTQVTLLGNVNGGTGAARALAFLAGTNERMRIESDGDVGIGTTAPTTIFHVQQNNASNIGMRMRQLSTTQFAGSGLLCNGPVSSGAQGGTGFYHYNRNIGGTNGALSMAQFDENGTFQRTLAEYYYQEQAWLFYTNSNERMRIANDGNVGIGTTSPGERLTVSGNVSATGNVAAAGSVSAGGVELGYRDLPVAGSLTRGQCFPTSAGVTINTATAGNLFTIYNDSAVAITLTQGAGVTLRLAGTTTTGNRTLAARGFANVWYRSGSEAIVSGSVS